MKLPSFNLVPPMPQSHYDPVICLRGDHQLSRQTFPFHNQRVITRRRKWIRQLSKHALPIMMNLAGLAMKQRRRTLYLPAESRPNGLVPQAHAKNRKLPCQSLNQLHGDPRFLWRTRSRRNHNPLRFFTRDLLNANLIVAVHFHLASQLTQILRQVVGKRVVVIEQQNHLDFLLPRVPRVFRPRATAVAIALPLFRCAASKAASNARDLFNVSRYSPTGVESATTPPPACT